ncbi:MAG: flavin reductase family protein [Pseudomonadota bacterium]
MDNNDQRALMGAFQKGITSGVYIITVKAKDKKNGMTASWISKVSQEPPMVMVSIGLAKYTGYLIKEAGCFAINTLAHGQQELGKHFGFVSGITVDKLKDIPSFEGKRGIPILKQAFSFLICECVDSITAGDHMIFIGKVVEGGIINPGLIPLVFSRDDFFPGNK